jgi:hypothetical protein
VIADNQIFYESVNVQPKLVIIENDILDKINEIKKEYDCLDIKT